MFLRVTHGLVEIVGSQLRPYELAVCHPGLNSAASPRSGKQKFRFAEFLGPSQPDTPVRRSPEFFLASLCQDIQTGRFLRLGITIKLLSYYVTCNTSWKELLSEASH